MCRICFAHTHLGYEHSGNAFEDLQKHCPLRQDVNETRNIENGGRKLVSTRISCWLQSSTEVTVAWYYGDEYGLFIRMSNALLVSTKQNANGALEIMGTYNTIGPFLTKENKHRTRVTHPTYSPSAFLYDSIVKSSPPISSALSNVYP